ncbi:MAG: undecaprenyl-diphosphate phosphatase [Candidatus Pacebacteria bacterium]|nr:undecaprenyl-diphosphate phosphatase [Candidatus Paceibacterota bacterium]
MDIFQTIILGIIEGITEFLPISSTGHLILANKLLAISQTDFIKSFEIAIQAGAILAVLVLYWETIFKWRTIKKLIVAFIPTAILGFIFYKIVKAYLLGSEKTVLWALLIGGVLLVLFELFYKNKSQEGLIQASGDIPYKKCFLIGCFQSIAMVPGVSRSAATIVGGMLSGISRKAIVEFSFLLAVPTMLAATGYDLLKSAGSFSLGQFNFLAVGLLISFLTAILGIKFLLKFIQKNTFIPFGIYRIALALLFFIFVIKF